MIRILKDYKMALKFIDIGANLTDSMFRGVYGGKQKHEDDFQLVLDRAWRQGLEKIIITVGTLSEADEALAIAKTDDRLFVTMGCHPTRCGEFQAAPEEYYDSLRGKIRANRDKVVAIGECGLDYDRLHFCEQETQKVYFEKQLKLAAEFRLPLFLHCRNAHADFMAILERNFDQLGAGGVVHSFDGTAAEAGRILAHGELSIGINGCSLKSSENLAVVKDLPEDRLMLETDAPWCSIRPTHASHAYVQSKFNTVKKKEKWTAESLIDGRCEPCQIVQVLEAVAGVKNKPTVELANRFYENTLKLFFNK